MSTRQLKQELKRILILMLFYKNDEHDYDIYVKSLKIINDELKRKRTYKNEGLTQFEYLIEKVIQKNTPENRERLKILLQSELLAKAKA